MSHASGGTSDAPRTRASGSSSPFSRGPMSARVVPNSAYRSSTVEPLVNASLNDAASTSKPSGSAFQRSAPGGVLVGESAQMAWTSEPGVAPYVASSHQ